MNLEAVALASDSAVTASAGHNTKIFGSQNKMFALSKIAPVGILVYGGATFMSIPWETLIKEYRHRYGTNVFPKLDDYVDDFCRFLAEDIRHSISTEQQVAFAETLVRVVYEDIIRIINEQVSVEMDQLLVGDAATAFEQAGNLIDNITTKTINAYSRYARHADLVEGAPEDFFKKIRQVLRSKRKSLRDEFFKRTLQPQIIRKLNTIADRSVAAMVDDITTQPTGLTTGIVIAGFGQEDLFPSFAEIHVEGLVVGVLKKRSGRRGATNPDNRASIVSFAQDDMIRQFMQGIAPVYESYLHISMMSHLSSYAKTLLENLEKYSDIERKTLLERMESVHPEIADSFVKQIDDIGTVHHASDIVDVVAMLPKEELAAMAEALVSLTSLKRRVSLEDETVGGPTDVALITKGDGLVWIKRKHYFPAGLNPAYFTRKYGIGGTEHAKNDTKKDTEDA